MSRYKVEISGVNTANLKVLKNEEMITLFKKVQQGDKHAREDLINGNLKLVLSILKKYSNRTDNMDDLFQVGSIGLVKAIDNFDLGHGVKFSTYAVPMILGEIRRYLRDNNSLRISRSIKDIAYKAIKLREEMYQENGIEPKLEEIAKILEVDYFDICNAFDSMKDPISMFEPIYNDGGDTIYLADQLEDKKENSSDKDINLCVANAIEKLKSREKQILQERFVIGKTQMEIAEELGISQAQVSRIEKTAITNVKKLVK